MMLRLLFAVCGLVFLFHSDVASAWGYQGHRVVGSIADQLLTRNAQRQVDRILAEDDPRRLGALDLRKVGPWADCAKSVVRHDDKTFHYEVFRQLFLQA
jgi:S1/P1 nuclease